MEELELKTKVAEEKFRLAKYNLTKAFESNKMKLDIILKACQLLSYCEPLIEIPGRAEYKDSSIIISTYAYRNYFAIECFIENKQIAKITSKKIIVYGYKKININIFRIIKYYNVLEKNLELLLNEASAALAAKFDRDSKLYKPD